MKNHEPKILCSLYSSKVFKLEILETDLNSILKMSCFAQVLALQSIEKVHCRILFIYIKKIDFD